MCFYKKDKEGKLMIILIVHVDDFLAAFRSDYNKKELENMFTCGSHGGLTLDRPIEFRGKQIKLVKGQHLLCEPAQLHPGARDGQDPKGEVMTDQLGKVKQEQGGARQFAQGHGEPWSRDRPGPAQQGDPDHRAR